MTQCFDRDGLHDCISVWTQIIPSPNRKPVSIETWGIYYLLPQDQLECTGSTNST